MIRPYYHETNLDPRFSRAWELQKEKCVQFDSIVELKNYIKMFNELTDWDKTQWYMWVTEFNQSFDEAFDSVWPENMSLLYPEIEDSITTIIEYLKNRVIVPDYIKPIMNAILNAYENYAEIDDAFIKYLEDANIIGEFVNPADEETWYYYKGE